MYPTIYIDSGTKKKTVISLDVENAFDNTQNHSKYESGESSMTGDASQHNKGSLLEAHSQCHDKWRKLKFLQ